MLLLLLVLRTIAIKLALMRKLSMFILLGEMESCMRMIILSFIAISGEENIEI